MSNRPLIKNAAYSIGEYTIVPLFHIFLIPLFVGKLGLELYGVWVLINSLVGLASGLDFGISDSTLRFVSQYRGRGESSSVIRTIRTAFWSCAPIAIIFGLLTFWCAHFFAAILFKVSPPLVQESIDSFKLGSVLLSVRVIDSAFVGALRGYERYDLTMIVSVVSRLTILLSAVLIILSGLGLKEILVSSITISIIALVIQGQLIHALMQCSPWIPLIDKSELKRIFHFGTYVWFQSVASIVFNQADRLIIGSMLGMPALTVYSVCLQITQHIQSTVGAAFSVVFPTVSRGMEATETVVVASKMKTWILLNIIVSVVVAAPFLLFAGPILSIWMGHEFMVQGTVVLRLLAVSFLIMSINVTPYFILMGVGEIKFVSLTGFLGGVANLIATILLVPIAGLNAAAFGRFIYAAVASLNFVRLKVIFEKGQNNFIMSPAAG